MQPARKKRRTAKAEPRKENHSRTKIRTAAAKTHVKSRVASSRRKAYFLLNIHEPDKTNCNIFRWNELPGELKNTIYGFLLKVDEPVHLHTKKRKDKLRHFVCLPRPRYGPAVKFVPKVLRLNKQILAEGSSLLYGNHFSFDRARTMYLFLSSLRSETKRLIVDVSVPVYAQYHLQPAFDSLVGTKNLRSVTIPCACVADRFYAKTHNWLETVGREKGDRYAALGLIRLDDRSLDWGFWALTEPQRRREKRKKMDEFSAALKKLL